MISNVILQIIFKFLIFFSFTDHFQLSYINKKLTWLLPLRLMCLLFSFIGFASLFFSYLSSLHSDHTNCDYRGLFLFSHSWPSARTSHCSPAGHFRCECLALPGCAWEPEANWASYPEHQSKASNQSYVLHCVEKPDLAECSPGVCIYQQETKHNKTLQIWEF